MALWINFIENSTGAFEFKCADSITTAIEQTAQFSADTLAESWSWLYVFTDEVGELVNKFGGIENPLDYPDRLIDRGPRGAWRVRRVRNGALQPKGLTMTEIVTRRGSFVITVDRNGQKVTSETLDDPMRTLTRFDSQSDYPG